MNLLSVYESILNTAGFVVDDQGLVSTILSGDKVPAVIEVMEHDEPVSKRLVLPTNEQLSAPGGWASRIAFHPLKENVVRGESKIVEYLRQAISYRLNIVIRGLMEETMKFALSPAHHKGLKSKQMQLIGAANEANETTIKNFEKIMQVVSPVNTRASFTSIYLKKLGKIGDNAYSCVAVINFPFYNDLLEAEKEFHGVKLRKADFKVYQNLLEYIIPGIQDRNEWQLGVNASIAPFAESLIRITDKIGKVLNKTTDILFKDSKYIPEEERATLHEFFYFKDDHMVAFEHLDNLLPEIKLIPPLPGNDEPEQKSLHVRQESTPPALFTPTETVNPYQQPQQHAQPKEDRWSNIQPVTQSQQPSSSSSGNGINLSEVFGQQQPMTPMMPPMFPYPQNYGYQAYPQLNGRISAFQRGESAPMNYVGTPPMPPMGPMGNNFYPTAPMMGGGGYYPGPTYPNRPNGI